MISIPLWYIPTFVVTLAVMFLSIGVFSSKFVMVKKFDDAIIRIEDKIDLKTGEVHERINVLIDKLFPNKT